MRRAFSISVIVALACSLFAPAFAATCDAMSKKPVCHRQNGVVHHCDTMGHHHQAEAASESSASVAAASNTSDCMTLSNGKYCSRRRPRLRITMGHHHQAEAASESSASVAAASNTSDCPMSCCNQAYFITGIAGHAQFVSPAQVVMNHEFHF